MENKIGLFQTISNLYLLLLIMIVSSPVEAGELRLWPVTLSAEEIFTKFTATAWCHDNNLYPRYIFHTDGYFYDLVPTDLIAIPEDPSRPAGNGSTYGWDLRVDKDGEYYVFLDTGEPFDFTFTAQGELIYGGIYGYTKFEPCPHTYDPGKYTWMNRPPLRASFATESMLAELTRSAWKSDTGKFLQFDQNLKYILKYDNGECEDKGYWFAQRGGSGSPEGMGHATLVSENDDCRPQNNYGRELRRHAYENKAMTKRYPPVHRLIIKRKGRISLGDEEYFPESRDTIPISPNTNN